MPRLFAVCLALCALDKFVGVPFAYLITDVLTHDKVLAFIDQLGDHLDVDYGLGQLC